MAVTTACGSSSAADSTPTAHGTTAGSSAPRAPACGPAAARTLAQVLAARVYEAQGQVYGCARGSTRRYQLGSATNCLRSARVRPVALAGSVAAYGLERCGVDTGSAAVLVKRLSTGRQLRSLPATSGRPAPESYQQVASLVVRADGAVAWIGAGSSIIRHSQTIEVHRADGRGTAELDAGPGIGPTSLRLHGRKLTWRHGGAMRTATLL